jgi:serine/threonine protein kinase
MPGTCPTTENLAAALRGRRSSAAEAELAAHLADCPACRARLEELAGGSGWLETQAKAHAAANQPASDSLHQAMQALESRSDSGAQEAASQVKLDFLKPSDQPGVLGRFGPYEVLAQVAIGGMGIVLKARDPGLNRIVALKILPPALAANSLARARFIREARAAAAVVHEHVVPIYAVDEFAGLPYLVMQFIEGRTLSDRLRATGPLRLEEILRIGAQTAVGLAAAHAQGLIHRDVKPGNILLENGVERVKITDFGLARATDDSSLTREGYIAGTPEYMSPEQARNEPVDQRADLFSFGCVLYEMATGVSPFYAEKPLVAMRRVCDEEPPAAHTLNPKLPEWLGQLIQRLMSKGAAARPETAAEVAAELGRRLAESQQAPGATQSPSALPSESQSRRFLQPAWAVVLVLALALAFFVINSMWTKSPADPQAVMTPSHPPSLPFVIPASDTGEAREFASLNQAVAAAAPGSVIEFRFNGSYATPPVQLERKPLILRAAPGFEPVLTAADPVTELLSTRAALVLEGLSFLISEPPVGAVGLQRPWPQRDHGIYVTDAPLLVAHCKFELLPNPVPRRHPGCLRLENVATAVFRRCEFVNPKGSALQWYAGQSVQSDGPGHRLSVQDWVSLGNFASLVGRWRTPTSLELRRSTFAGEHLFVIPLPTYQEDNLPDYQVMVSQCLLTTVARMTVSTRVSSPRRSKAATRVTSTRRIRRRPSPEAMPLGSSAAAWTTAGVSSNGSTGRSSTSTRGSPPGRTIRMAMVCRTATRNDFPGSTRSSRTPTGITMATV